jgi:tRNA dimethylallyltransferase
MGKPFGRPAQKAQTDLAAAAEGAVMDTRRYAKRQLTWFRNQLPDWLGLPHSRP